MNALSMQCHRDHENLGPDGLTLREVASIGGFRIFEHFRHIVNFSKPIRHANRRRGRDPVW